MAKEAGEEKQEMQEPAKPKKSGGGMKPIVMIGVGAGVLLVNAVIILLIFNFFIAPSLNQGHSDEGGDTHKKEKVKKSGGDESEEDKFLTDEKEMHFWETGRISTNLHASTKLLTMNLGLEYRKKVDEDEEEEGAEGGDFPPVLVVKMKSLINGTIGSYTYEEINASRDSLNVIFKNKMKPLLKKNKMYLREVYIQEFIITGD